MPFHPMKHLLDFIPNAALEFSKVSFAFCCDEYSKKTLQRLVQ